MISIKLKLCCLNCLNFDPDVDFDTINTQVYNSGIPFCLGSHIDCKHSIVCHIYRNSSSPTIEKLLTDIDFDKNE